MDWPNSLIEELASRRCLIFLGAGISRSSESKKTNLRPPSWKDLLISLKEGVSENSKNVVDDLISKGSFLDAAEIITNNIPKADFTNIIRKLFVQPKFQFSTIHKMIIQIDPKVVVTTNYDTIYDEYSKTGLASDGYNVCKYYESHLVSDLRSPTRLIVKAHGCISDPAKIVLSRSQYFEARQKYGQFYKILDALFLTNTVLFLGYSISDPDIQLTLENANISANSSHPHYALVEDNIIPEMEAAMEKAYNIHFIKFPKGDFSKAEEMITNLKIEVEHKRSLAN